jgi:carbonic anhydrase
VLWPLGADWATCKTGTEQSPITLTSASRSIENDLSVDYPDEVTFDASDNGHTVQISPSGRASVTSDGDRFDLVQIHFHTPSEHEIDGAKADAEFHFVHADAEGDLLVVGVLANEGAEFGAWVPFIDAAGAPTHKGDNVIDLAALLPESLDHFEYEGSLTTPPCSEGVEWRVLQTPIELSAGQLAQLRSAHDDNARPVQPLHGR